MPKVNWLKIRNEYINGYVSYRELAAEYRLNLSTLGRRAKKESWQELRDGQRDKVSTKTLQKTAEKLVDQEVDYMVSISRLNYEMAAALWRILQADKAERFLTVKDIKTLTAALKDIAYIDRNTSTVASDTDFTWLIADMKKAQREAGL